MWRISQYYILFISLLVLAGPLLAQEKEKIKYQAEELQYGKKDGERYRQLTGNVVFKQKNTTVYCDTSYLYQRRNTMESFGNVRIEQESSIITSDELNYDGDKRVAKLRQNVVYEKDEFQMYTDHLNYDLEEDIAHYFLGGQLMDGENDLTSDIGYYFSNSEFAQFYRNVHLVTPDFTLDTDTLRYNMTTKTAYTYGPTRIVSEDGTVLNSTGGEYRTRSEETDFKNGTVETEDYYLEASFLSFDDKNKYYKAVSNVKMTAKDRDVVITGDEGFYDRRKGVSKIYGRAVMKRVLEADTFYLAADTLVALESDYDSAKRILAYPDIRVFKEGLQGIADSMAYFTYDSLLVFYSDPIMWNSVNQITADTIKLQLGNDQIQRMDLRSRGFMVSEDSINNYNQIKGRNMEAYFQDNEISRIDVNGNGEVLYFALEKGDSVLMGMNKVFCATMVMRFEDQKLNNFSVYNRPEAKFIPPHELTQELKQLEGFSWRIEERPELYHIAPYLQPGYVPTIENQPTEQDKDIPNKENIPKLAPLPASEAMQEGNDELPVQEFKKRDTLKSPKRENPVN